MERKAMHLRSWMLTLAIGLAASAASATPPPRTPAKIAWRPLLKAAPGKTPWCFAYSPAHRAYACLGSAPSDSDQSARAGYVDLLGGHATKTVVESHAVAGAVKPIAPTTAIDARLAELGFTSVPLEATTLTPDEWHPVDDAAVRLSVRLHEGDASFEYFGDVTVRCPNAREIEVNVRKLGRRRGRRRRHDRDVGQHGGHRHRRALRRRLRDRRSHRGAQRRPVVTGSDRRPGLSRFPVIPDG
jgi:hypothetical protein